MVNFLQNVVLPHLSGFLSKNQIIFQVAKIRKYDEETVFSKKKLSSFDKASLPEWEGAKYAGGNRPSCLS